METVEIMRFEIRLLFKGSVKGSLQGLLFWFWGFRPRAVTTAVGILLFLLKGSTRVSKTNSRRGTLSLGACREII